MPCGITKVINGTVVTCDNAASNPHGGTQHSGIIPNAYGYLINKRVWWAASDTNVAYRRVLTVGDKE